MRTVHIDRSGQLWFGEKLSIHLLLLPLCFAAAVFRYFPVFAVSWGSALLHETAHIGTARALGVPIRGIGLFPFGVCARLKDPIIKSPAKEIVIALAGPLCSLFLAAVCHLLSLHHQSELLSYAAAVSFAMALLNLLPCLPLDGGRVLRAMLTLGSDAMSARQTTLRISYAVALLVITAAVFLLLTASFQFYLLLIGVFLLGNLCTEQKSISRQTLRELLYHKDKLEKDGLRYSAVLCAYQDLPARRLLRRLSYHKYYTIQVLDQREEILGTLTEGQILTALLEGSIRQTLGEILADRHKNHCSKNSRSCATVSTK